MTRNFTRLTSVLTGLICMCVYPLKGQRVDAGFAESRINQHQESTVQIRNAAPIDSIITYSTAGEPIKKTVRYDNGASKCYLMVNNWWIDDGCHFVSVQEGSAMTCYIQANQLRVYFPTSWDYGWYWYTSSDVKYTTGHDSRGNLTSVIIENGQTAFSATYDTNNNLITWEVRENNILTVKANYQHTFNMISFFECQRYNQTTKNWESFLGKTIATWIGTFQPVSVEKYKPIQGTNNWIGDTRSYYEYADGRRYVHYEYVWYGSRWSLVQYSISYPNTRMPQTEVAENKPVDSSNKGSYLMNVSVPVDSIRGCSFVIQFPEGFTLDETNTHLSLDFGNFELIITKQENNCWLFEIKPKTLRSASLRAGVTKKMLQVAYTVDEKIKRGTYPISVNSILFETKSGNYIPEPAITVAAIVERLGVGVETAEHESIWAFGSNLYIRTDKAGMASVYTLPGQLIRQQTVGAGETVIPLPQGMYFVKFGVGTQKIVVR